MFLIERLVGLIVYLVLLGGVLLLIEQRNSHYKIILFFYAISLGIVGFFYLPYKDADLYRIYKNLELYSKYNWKKFYLKQLNGNIFQIDLIYYWLIAKTGELHLLPALTAFICFSCVFYIIIRTAKMYRIDRNNIVISLFFFMSIGNYMVVISNIRTMLGVCLLCLCFFRESIEKKFRLWHIPVYFIAGFIHKFVFVLVFVRLISHIFCIKKAILKKSIYFIFIVLISLGVRYFFPNYLNGVIEKAEKYVTEKMYSYFWEYAIGVLTGVGLILILFYLKKYKIQKSELSESRFFLIICLIIASCFIFEFSIFHRTITYIAPILALPLLMITLQRETELRRKNFKNIIFGLTIILLIIVSARGSLCGLKFFVL